jgi:hypothetical protein
MKLESVLNNQITPLHPEDRVSAAVEAMQKAGLIEFPVVNDGTFVGIVSQKMISGQNDKMCIKDLINQLDNSHYIPLHSHWFDVLKEFDRPEGSCLVVLDDNMSYLGIIDEYSFFQSIVGKSSFRLPGSVLILEVNTHDYMLSRIAQIVEAQNAKIICLDVETNEQSPFIRIHIKLNTLEITGISRELERYGYRILESYQKRSKFSDDLLDNYNALMKYLEV